MRGGSQFTRGSHKPPRASHGRDATVIVCGFTAGGSGTASSEAITMNAPRTQTMYDFDLIPACVPTSMIKDFERCNSAKSQETVSPAEGSP
jgi:hypothetical protein